MPKPHTAFALLLGITLLAGGAAAQDAGSSAYAEGGQTSEAQQKPAALVIIQITPGSPAFPESRLPESSLPQSRLPQSNLPQSQAMPSQGTETER